MPEFTQQVLDFSNADDFGLSELVLTLGACDVDVNITCAIQTKLNESASDNHQVAFMGDQGYPAPYGLLVGPDPPTDGADWSFTYGCATLESVENATVWLETNSTSGTQDSNTTLWVRDNVTCLSNSTYIAELTLPFGECMDFTCYARYDGKETLNFTDASYCYQSTGGDTGVAGWKIALVVIVSVVLVLILVVGIYCYMHRRSKGYENIEKIH